MQSPPVRMVALFGALAVIFVASALIYYNLRQLVGLFGQVEHEQAVVNEVRELQGYLIDVETAVRGYALTYDTDYLGPFHVAMHAIPGVVNGLRDLTGDIAENKLWLDRLTRLIEERLELARMVTLRIDAGVEDTSEVPRTFGRGKELMDEIRFLLGEVIGRVEGSYSSHRGDVARHAETTIVIVIVCVLVSGIIIVFVGSLMQREVLRRRRAESDLQALNLGLEERIQSRTKELGRSNDTLRAVISSSPVAIVTVDAALSVTGWNGRAEEIFGRSAADAIGTRFEVLPRADASQVRDLFAGIAAGEVVRNVELLHRRDDSDTPVRVVYSSGPLHDNSGARSGAVIAVEDVTERRVVEQQLHHAQKMEAVGQLTGGLAHDFNNLLAVIIGNLDLLTDELKSAQTKGLVETALAASMRGAELTRQLLAFSRQQPLHPRQVNINEFLSGMSRLLQRTLGESMEIETRFAPDIWPAVADPSQVEAALINMTINARDAMPGGGNLLIETGNRTLDEVYVAMNPGVVGGDYVMLAVSDTGSGIPPEILDRVFEPFFTTKGPGKGSGLGLSMIYGFAKQSGGHVKIYSEIDVGTTIRLYLPRAAADSAQEPVVATVPDEPSGNGETILVVEDSTQVRETVCRQLRHLLYHTLEAADGPAALEILRTGVKIDLLFTDVVMSGGLSGAELAAKALKLRPNLRTLFTSGFPDTVRSGGRLAPAHLLLSKPYRRQALAQRIRETLDAEAPAVLEITGAAS